MVKSAGEHVQSIISLPRIYPFPFPSN